MTFYEKVLAAYEGSVRCILTRGGGDKRWARKTVETYQKAIDEWKAKHLETVQ